LNMKISILTSDLSHNCFGRAYILGKILQKYYEVEVVGPVFGEGIWGPVADDNCIIYKSIKIADKLEDYRQVGKLVKMIDGDVIYASKPRFWSYDVGLFKKWFSKKPLVLDIDDWELGFLIDRRKNGDLVSRASRVNFWTPGIKSSLRRPNNSYSLAVLNEKLVKFADEITVSNNFLNNRFGGTIVWHARDTECFDPGKFDKNSIRAKYGIPEMEKVVIFCGTPRRHKGIEDLITALRQTPDVLLIILGVHETRYCQELVSRAKRELGNDRVRVFGVHPFSKIPEFLAMSDIVVLPQLQNCATVGQVPAKVFDGMAMAKPIIASKVSDLADILKDCGWLVEPQRPDELAKAIRYVLDHPEESEKKGQKARERCKRRYSFDAMGKVLCGLFRKYER
jgi:glycosyltransferase involved in cell wall biosynthesis